MIIVNFSHPLSDENIQQIKYITHQQVIRIYDHLAEFDSQEVFLPQVTRLINEVGLLPRQWQTEPILFVLPALNFITAILLAELEGRMGYLPTIVRLREVMGVLPRKWEVVEILDLQTIREESRKFRKG